jgi:hypothetical protein
MDLLIQLDHTGSMSSLHASLRNEIKRLIRGLKAKIPTLRVAVILHNDYGDAPHNLIFEHDFTSSMDAVEAFINQTFRSGGQGPVAAYTPGLHLARSLNWRSAERAMVLFGDEKPHEKGAYYHGHTEKHDWREEARALGEMGVPIFAVQCLGNRSRSYFYEGLAGATKGVKLDLAQFAHVPDYILAIANREAGTLDDFEAERPEYKTNIAYRQMFAALRGLKDQVLGGQIGIDKLSRFQVVPVSYPVQIKEFVNQMGLHYQRGRGYYQLIMREKIQGNKEILMQNRVTGEVIDDTMQCRQMLGIPAGVQVSYGPRDVPFQYRDWDIYVQSNSYTRNLDPQTNFLYELHHH